MTTYILSAQENHNGISASFLKTSTTQTTSGVASNVLKVVNHTSKTQEIIISIGKPGERWGIIGDDIRGIRLLAEDSMFIPVRIIPDKQATGNTNYFISALLSINNTQVGYANWMLMIEKKSEWNALLPLKKVYFPVGSDTTVFSLQVKNQGNAEENLVLTLSSDPNIIVADTTTGLETGQKIFSLPPSSSTTFIFFAIKKPKDKNLTQTENEELKSKKFSIKLKIKNQKSGNANAGYWTGNLDVFDVPQELKAFENGYNSIPLNIEFNAFDLMSPNSYSTLDLYGNTKLPGQRMLAYYVQTPFTSNYINPRTYLGQYHFLSYESDKLLIGLGSVNSGRPGSTLSGIGGMAGYRMNDHYFSALGVRSPYLFNNYQSWGYAFNYRYQHNNLYADNYFQHKNEILNKVRSDIGNTILGFQPNRNHSLRFGLGYSLENHYWNPANELNLPGYYYSALYSGQFKKLQLSLVNYYGSKNYSEFRGIFSLSMNAIYRFNETKNLTFGATHIENNPEMYTKGQKQNYSFYSRRDLFSLKYSILTEEYNLSFNPFVEYYDYQQLRTLNKSVAFDFHQRNTSQFKFYSTVVAGYMKAMDYDIPDFFVANIKTTVRYNRLTANLRYYYGPFFTREQLDFIETKIYPQRLFLSAYYDWWFNNGKCLLTFNTDYNYSSRYKRGLWSTRPEFFYYMKHKFRLSAYARYILFSENEDGQLISQLSEEPAGRTVTGHFEVGFGIKKEIGIPLSFKKYKDLKIIVFKDLNGNGKQDLSEPGIRDILITVQKIDSNTIDLNDELTIDHSSNKLELVTNKKGMVIFNNMPGGDYKIQTLPLSSQGGWFDGKKMSTVLDHDKTMLIPLTKGVKIEGSLFIEREKYSHFGDRLNVAGIRVTAIDSTGKTYSSLTDMSGTFSMFVPGGRYIISVNEAALGDRFKFNQNNVPVSLRGDIDNYSLSFYIVEKTRKLEVKKFDSKGNLITSPQNSTEPVKEEKSGYIKNSFKTNNQASVKPDKDIFTISPTDKMDETRIDDKITRIENKLENIEQSVGNIEEQISNPEGKRNVFNGFKPNERSILNTDHKIGPAGSIITRNISEIPGDKLSTIKSDEFYIILGSFKNANNAIDAVTQFGENGFTTVIIYNDIRDWYYVCLDTYFSYREAINKFNQLKRKGVNNWIYFQAQEEKINQYKR